MWFMFSTRLAAAIGLTAAGIKLAFHPICPYNPCRGHDVCGLILIRCNRSVALMALGASFALIGAVLASFVIRGPRPS